MNLAAGYCRVSSARQAGADHASLETQREDIAEYARRHGLTVSRWYTDIESAYQRGRVREHVEALLDDAETGLFQHVIMWKSDRFGRRAGLALVNLDELEHLGVELHSVKDNVKDFMARGVNLLVAEQSSRDTALRVKSALETRARQGYFPNKLPPGLRRVFAHGQLTKDIEPDPDSWPVVFELFERRMAGESITDLCVFARSRGLPLDRATVWELLQNPIYCGKVPWKGDVFEGRHAAFVPEEWVHRKVPVGRRPGHWLARLGRCLNCGGAMSNSDNGRGLRYFRCQRRKPGNIPDPCCRAVPVKDVEEWLIPQLKALTFAPGNLEAIEEQMNAEHHRALESWRTKHAGAERERTKLHNRISALADRMLDGTIDAATYRAKHAEYTDRLRELEAVVESAPKATSLRGLDEARRILAAVADVWDGDDDEVKGILAHELIRALWLRPESRRWWRVEWSWSQTPEEARRSKADLP